MEKDEVVRRLKEKDCFVESARVNGAGRTVYLVRLGSGEKVAMFHADAADLVSGSATLTQIITRNVGAHFADPWPAAN
jgi:hypothetical protein